MRHYAICALLLPAALLADGTTPKPNPAEYPVQAQAGDLTIAAEYNVRTFGAGASTFWTQDYLVVEVALYSPSKQPQPVTINAFTLRINGKKDFLMAQSPNFVAASLKYQDWELRPHIEAGAGAGDTGVILGRPQQTERFPGDPTSTRTRLPNPPRAPGSPNPTGADDQPAKTPAEVAAELALPEGERVLPVSGYIYFPYKGKPKSLKSVELVFQGQGSTTTLKLK